MKPLEIIKVIIWKNSKEQLEQLVVWKLKYKNRRYRQALDEQTKSGCGYRQVRLTQELE